MIDSAHIIANFLDDGHEEDEEEHLIDAYALIQMLWDQGYEVTRRKV